MVKRKISFSILLVVLCIFSHAFPSYAENLTSTISGSIRSSVIFSKQDAQVVKEQYINRLSNEKNLLKEKIVASLDNVERERLNTQLKGIETFDVEKMFVDKEDGTVALTNPMPFLEIKIGEQTTVANEKGNYALDGVSFGNQSLVLSYQGSPIKTTDITITSARQLANIELISTKEQFTNSSTIRIETMAIQQQNTQTSLRFIESNIRNLLILANPTVAIHKDTTRLFFETLTQLLSH